MSPLPITLACGNYDRTRPLINGIVQVEGAEVDYRIMGVGPMLAGAARGEFDVVEHSLSTVVMQHGPDSPYVPLAVFPSRVFRQNGIYVRADSQIESPSQMRGWKVGISGYTVTGMVWIRGMLADCYDLPIDSVTYVNGGLDTPGAPPLRGAVPPAGIVVEDVKEGATLSQLLCNGEIDAIYSLHTPHAIFQPDSPIRRLFANVRAEERRYFEST
ncbi:MAG TPA: hypothetical protein VG368_07825, partial [Acidimicrobiales bacterium]|nr:hypothetical protein [Acidimicrobiales bacterium]